MKDWGVKIDNNDTSAGFVGAEDFNSAFSELESTVSPFMALDVLQTNQLVKSIDIIAKATHYTDGGTQNALSLTRGATATVIETLFDGMVVSFTPAFANNGATTINVSGTGVKPLKFNGADLAINFLTTDYRFTAIYDATNSWFECVDKYTTTAIMDKAVATAGVLIKPVQHAPLFTKATVSTITIPIGTKVLVGSTVVEVAGSAYTLSLNTTGVGALDTGVKTAGRDYCVYALESGGFIISENKTNPTGYTTVNSRKIGGFHYGVIPEAFTAINNITASDATIIAGINGYSFWDLKFRPVCEPYGMVFVFGKWYDIYLLNTDHHLYGTSSAGKTIAGGAVLNGRNFPKIPLFYGGNGTVTYGTLTWFEACEIGKAYSKELISYEEFVAIAYGVLEATSAGASDTGVTQHLANFTSKFGICMVTGCQYIWSKDTTAIVTSPAWSAVTEGRGSVYSNSNGAYSAVLGGNRDGTVESGSRCSAWHNYLWDATWALGCRYACNHLELA